MRLKKTYAKVLYLLRENELYRNDDGELIVRVLEDQKRTVFSQKLQESFVSTTHIKKFKFESIRRARQQVQHDHPELAPTDPNVRKARRLKESTKGAWIQDEFYTAVPDGLRS